MKSGMSELEEFLKEKYVESIQNSDENETKVEILISKFPEYFYVPRLENFGMLDYIEYEGKALYLIKKSGLPKEIQESLNAGDAGEGTYLDYLGLNDVYGVTSDLKVYYCSNGLDSITNLSKENIDEAVERDIFNIGENSNTGLGKLLSPYDSNKDGNIKSSEISSIKELNITEKIDLKDIYNLYSLEKLVITNIENVDLSGIENCMKLNYIWFNNSSASNYEPIGELGSKLNKLYFTIIVDSELEKLCSELGKYDLPNLKYLGLFGTLGSGPLHGPHTASITTRENKNIYPGRQEKSLTKVSDLNKLSLVTKKAVKYLYIPCNRISSLDGINEFTNLVELNAYGNNLSDIKALGNMKSLEYLQLYNNKFNDTENRSESDKTNDALYVLRYLSNLYWLDISGNEGIGYVSHLSGLTNLKYIYMDRCPNLKDVVEIKDLIKQLKDRTVDSEYTKDIIDPETYTSLSYYDQTINIEDFKTIGECTKLTHLNLRKTRVVKGRGEILEGEDVEDLMEGVFSRLTSLRELSINGLTLDLGDDKNAQKISNLNFLKLEDGRDGDKGLKNTLVILDIRNTNVNVNDDNGNAEILNKLEKLDCFAVNNDDFDFSKVQNMLNRFTGTRYKNMGVNFFNSTSWSTGIVCQSWRALQTLEKCSNLKTIVSETHDGAVTPGSDDKVLDLSGCDQLEKMDVYPWKNFTVKFPDNIKNILSVASAFNFDFEESSNGITIDEITIDENETENIISRIRELEAHNIKVKSLVLENVSDNRSGIVDALLEGDGCNWIEHLGYDRENWAKDLWDTQIFYRELNKLKDSSIKSLEFKNCSEVNLEFIKELTKLEKISMQSSKIVGISDLEPKYENGNLVSGFPELKELSLPSNSVTNISVLENLKNLTFINLSSNKINAGIESLSKLTELQYLNLKNNDLSNVSKYVDLSNRNGKEDFINIFLGLHTEHHLNELYLTGTGVQNIFKKLNVHPEWGKKGLNSSRNPALQCDS